MPLSEQQESMKEYDLPSKILDISIVYNESGKAFSTQEVNGNKTFVVNTKRFTSSEALVRKICIEAGLFSEINTALQRDTKEFLKLKNKSGLLHALKIVGLQKLKRIEPEIVERISLIDANSDKLSEVFEYACQQYILTGVIPRDISPEVQRAMRNIKSKGGKNALDFIASGQYSLEVMTDMYEKYVLPELEKFKQKERIQTSGDAYKPRIDTGEETPLEEGQIEQKVEPFYGGYYRGRVYYYDPDKLEMVEDETTKEAFTLEFPEEEVEEMKRYTFSGIYDPTKENIIRLPYKALPLPSTLRLSSSETPPNVAALHLMRDTQGVFSIEPQNKKSPGMKIPFQFEFVCKSSKENSLCHPPEEKNLKILGTPMDQETEVLIDELSQSKHLLTEEKVKKVVTFVRKKFKYPDNEGERNTMNELYLQAGKSVLQKMCEHKVADCHWADIFASEILKRLEIPVQLPGEFYIQKDPRFAFAAIGGIGHVWGEFYNGKEWLRYDATPSQEKEEENEEKEKSEGDYGEQDPPKDEEEWSMEKIEELFQHLFSTGSRAADNNKPPVMFEGVPLSKWQEVERFIQQVNTTPISAEMSIRKKTSTLYDEWRALFDLIYQKREIPQQVFRGPVRQSEGDLLDDPVDVYIDLMSHEPDPMGFKKEAHPLKEKLEITEFEDDVIGDLTSSMKDSGAALEQKKMILTNSYNIMALNRRLNLTYNRNKMQAALKIRTHIASFKGETTSQIHHLREQDMNEKKLCELYDAFDSTEAGTGNLYGALLHYRDTLTPELKTKLKKGALKKVLTIISDGQIDRKSEVVELVQELRTMGIIVQGIGFGVWAQHIRVICHDPNDAQAAIVLEDVREATLARHQLLVRHLKGI